MTVVARCCALMILLLALVGCETKASNLDKALAQLDRIADELMKSTGIPGMAVAVVHGGKTLYAKGFGVKDVTKSADAVNNQVDPDTVFQLASVSKSLAGTVVAHVVDSGAVTWNTPVVDKLTGFALADPAVTKMLTIGDLMSHRSGLPDHAGDRLEDLGYDRRTVLDRLRLLPLDEFRISYAYTNFGFTAGALAASAATGKPWEDLSREALYEPLGMHSTSSRYADFDARTNKARGHIAIDGKYEPRYHRDADAQAPAASVSSSVNDMTHWLTMLLADGTYQGKQIVSPAALLPAVTAQAVSNRATEPAKKSGFYGYGFNVGTTSSGRVQLGHSGAFELGAATTFLALPDEDVAIVALTNSTPCGVPETLTAEFADLVQYGEVREDWRKLYADAFAKMAAPEGVLVGAKPRLHPAPSKPLQSYTGSYANPYWGPATIVEKDGALHLSLGPRDHTFDLQHWDGDVFTFSFVSENSPPGSVSKATFDGNRLTLEYFDEEKMGTFTR